MEHIKLYTDGGCRGNQTNKNIGAYGFRLEFWVNGELIAEKEESKGEYNTTNNIQELKGMINGLKAINDKEMKTIVYSDSAYCINGITSWIDGWKQKGWVNSKKEAVKNRELWIELDNLRNQFRDISFIKVKGHSTDEGNNRVDFILNEEMDKLEKIKGCDIFDALKDDMGI